MRTATWAVLVGLFGLSAAGSVSAAKKDKVDHLGLAALMIRDGYAERAANILAQVDETDEKLDRVRFHTLRGVTRLQMGELEGAVEDFTASLEKGQTETMVYVYLGQAYFQLENYEAALAALDAAGEAAGGRAAVYGMRAQAHWRLNQHDEGWQTLLQGMAQHPDENELKRLQVFFAIDRGLFAAAAELGRAYLAQTDGKADDYLGISAALDRSGSAADALAFLELAHLRFPENTDVLTAMAKIYRDRGDTRTAAGLLERASLRGNSDYLLDAAELYRTSGAPHTALALNGRVADQEARLRQRLALLLDLRRYRLVTAMQRDLERAGLLNDDSVRYAVAYSYFKNGDYRRTEKNLARLTDAKLFRQAAELRRAMQECRDEPWRC